MKTERKNIPLKLLSLAIALLLWLIVNGETDTSFRSPARLNYLLPEGLVSTQKLTEEVQLTLKGPLFLTRNIDKLKATFDLRHIRRGLATTLSLPKGSFTLPMGVEVVSIDPPFISLLLERETRRQLPVSLVTTGDAAGNYEIDLERSRLSPDKIWVKGPRSVLRKLNQIFTLPIDIQERREAFALDVELDFQDQNLNWESEENVIRAEIFFREIPTEKGLTDEK